MFQISPSEYDGMMTFFLQIACDCDVRLNHRAFSGIDDLLDGLSCL